jgi:hypothetical protein
MIIQATTSTADATFSLWSGGGVFTTAPPPTTMTPTTFGAYNFENAVPANEYQGVLADNTYWHNMDGRLFENFEVFRVDFHQPTDFVHIFGGGFGMGDPFTAYAYDSAGKVLGAGYCGGIGSMEGNGPCDFAFGNVGGAQDIAFAIAAGSRAGQYVTAMTYDSTSVAEPGTLGLMGFILIMLITSMFHTRGRK